MESRLVVTVLALALLYIGTQAKNLRGEDPSCTTSVYGNIYRTGLNVELKPVVLDKKHDKWLLLAAGVAEHACPFGKHIGTSVKVCDASAKRVVKFDTKTLFTVKVVKPKPRELQNATVHVTAHCEKLRHPNQPNTIPADSNWTKVLITHE